MGSERGEVVCVNVSQGGVPKRPVERAWVSAAGVQGDRQDDTVNHGGPDRAVCIYALELIQALRAEGHPIEPGWAGENLTVRGVDWDSIAPGTCFTAGMATMQVTSFTVPCQTIRDAFLDGRFTRISQKVNPGWSRVYAKVLVPGEVRPGDVVTVLDP